MSRTMQDSFDHQLLQRHAFGLADPSMLAELPDGIAGVPLVPRGLEASAHLMPVLVDLRALPPEASGALLACLQDACVAQVAPPVPVLVDTGLSLDAFVKYWNALQLPSSPGGQRSWLRMHDARVLHHVWRILAPAQRRALLGDSNAISYWLGDAWCEVRADRACPLPGESVALAGTAGWDWSRIGDIGTVNRALNGAGIHGPATVDGHADLVEELLERARLRHQLSRQADLVEFALRGLTAGARFDDHPAISAAIADGAGEPGESDLADRLALVDDHVWQSLRQSATSLAIAGTKANAGTKATATANATVSS
jgi:hypothetical protein